jgi:hypothetical protein
MALGGVIGGILGAAVGSVVPGVGTTIGASLGTGAGQLIQGATQKKKAQGMSPSPVDVGRQKLLLDLYRMQQAKKTGTAYNPQITAGKQMAKSFAKNSFNAGGMPNQGAYSALLGQTMNNIAAQSAQDITQDYGLIDKSVEQTEKRAFDLASLAQTKVEADSAKNLSSGTSNFFAGLDPKGNFSNPYDQSTTRKKKKTTDNLGTEEEEQQS